MEYFYPHESKCLTSAVKHFDAWVFYLIISVTYLLSSAQITQLSSLPGTVSPYDGKMTIRFD